MKLNTFLGYFVSFSLFAALPMSLTATVEGLETDPQEVSVDIKPVVSPLDQVKDGLAGVATLGLQGLGAVGSLAVSTTKLGLGLAAQGSWAALKYGMTTYPKTSAALFGVASYTLYRRFVVLDGTERRVLLDLIDRGQEDVLTELRDKYPLADRVDGRIHNGNAVRAEIVMAQECLQWLRPFVEYTIFGVPLKYEGVDLAEWLPFDVQFGLPQELKTLRAGRRAGVSDADRAKLVKRKWWNWNYSKAADLYFRINAWINKLEGFRPVDIRVPEVGAAQTYANGADDREGPPPPYHMVVHA